MNRYPLSWPSGWRRSKHHRSGNFKHFGQRLSVHQGVARVLDELRLLGVMDGNSIISTNISTRMDGLPRGNEAEPADSGVAVYWEEPLTRGTKVMAIDLYDTVSMNLGAIAATLAAIRAIERHGGAQILERVFTGFDALPAPEQTSRTWKDVLELNGDATLDKARENYRRLCSARHPDKPGGSHDAMSELNLAWTQAQQALQP